MTSTRFTVKGIRPAALADRATAKIHAIAGWVATRSGGSLSPTVVARQAWVGVDATIRFVWALTGTQVQVKTSGSTDFWRNKEIGTLTQAITAASTDTPPQKSPPIFDQAPGGQITYEFENTDWLASPDLGVDPTFVESQVLGKRGGSSASGGSPGASGGRATGSPFGNVSIGPEDILSIVTRNRFPKGFDTYEKKAGWLRAMQIQFREGSGIWEAYSEAQMLLRQQYFPQGPW